MGSIKFIRSQGYRLTSERWQQIEELYHSARERGSEALASADPEIRKEVERLLAHDAEGGDKLLDQDAAGLLADSSDAPIMLGTGVDRPPTLTRKSPFAPGVLLGRYTIVALPGAGGMGEVYRSTDAALGRDLAIKVVH